jgi:hypothetical protein
MISALQKKISALQIKISALRIANGRVSFQYFAFLPMNEFTG